MQKQSILFGVLGEFRAARPKQGERRALSRRGALACTVTHVALVPIDVAGAPRGQRLLQLVLGAPQHIGTQRMDVASL